MVLVGTVLSLAFMAVGEPYFILVGAFAGIVEIVPVIGPITAGGAVVLAVPLVAVLVTVLDVAVRAKDPAAEDVPTVLFPAKEAER